MPRERFEPTISGFKRYKTKRAIDILATRTGLAHDAGDMILRNVGILSHPYSVSQARSLLVVFIAMKTSYLEKHWDGRMFEDRRWMTLSQHHAYALMLAMLNFCAISARS
jgi:hypothetical protein